MHRVEDRHTVVADENSAAAAFIIELYFYTMTEGGKTDSLLRATETVDELAPPAQPMVEVWAHDVAGESPAAKLCSATVSPGGVVAIGTSNGLIMVFNIWEHFQLSTTVDSRSSNSDRPAPITALAFSQRADDSLLVSGHADGRVILWDTANVNQVAKFAVSAMLLLLISHD